MRFRYRSSGRLCAGVLSAALLAGGAPRCLAAEPDYGLTENANATTISQDSRSGGKNSATAGILLALAAVAGLGLAGGGGSHGGSAAPPDSGGLDLSGSSLNLSSEDRATSSDNQTQAPLPGKTSLPDVTSSPGQTLLPGPGTPANGGETLAFIGSGQTSQPALPAFGGVAPISALPSAPMSGPVSTPGGTPHADLPGSITPQQAPPSVPEPSGALMGIMAAALAGGWTWRRRAQRAR